MDTQKQEQTLVVHPKKALYIFGGAGVILVILSLIGQYINSPENLQGIHFPFQVDIISDYTLEFDFAGKPDIVIYYNVLILNLAAFLLFVISYFKKMDMDQYRFHWRAMAWIVLVLAIDNMAVIHKKINEYFQGEAGMGAWYEYKWVITWIVVFAILIILFFRFWQHLESTYRILFLAPAVMYFAGAVGKEAAFLIPLDQVLQYGAATLMIYSALSYLKSHYPIFSVSSQR